MQAASMAPADAAGWSDWPAPAKLNLFLHVVGRRGDGYHLLQTVFQLLDWGDTVRIRVRNDDSICRINPLPAVDATEDLAMRAAHALRSATACRRGADIAIDKRIPLGGGLGGGSSDAATVLSALNALWNTGLDTQALAAIGLQLGADVPVFVRGHSAWAEGVGERLTSIDLPPQWYVIIDPGVSVPTAELFGVADLTRNAAHLTIPLFASGAATFNVFEPVVRERFASVAVSSREAGSSIAAACPAGMRGFVVRGVAQSPLSARLREWRAAQA